MSLWKWIALPIALCLLAFYFYEEQLEPVPSALESSCIECPDDVDLRRALETARGNALVLTAQEIGSPCCATYGYTDTGLEYCQNPRFIQGYSPYKTLHSLHCEQQHLVTVYSKIQFECENSGLVAIANTSLASAYTLAFMLMKGFNCSY